MSTQDTEKLRNIAYAAKLLRLQEERARQTGPGGLMHFVRHFWKVLEPGREFVDGWVLHAVAEHLEAIERGEITRLLVTIPPGFMKSLMINVWFMCWLWGPQNKPHFRSLSFSYASHLTERDNDKCRTLINSRPYQELWGDRFKLSSDSKIKISNDHQGWLLASSVGGVSTGERGDLIRCCKKDTLVATEDGSIMIGRIVTERLPIKVWSQNTETGEISLQNISAWRHNPGASLVKVTFSDGSSLQCTPDHRIWTSVGWKPAIALKASDVIPCAPVLDVCDSLGSDAVYFSNCSQAASRHVENLKSGTVIQRLCFSVFWFSKYIPAIPNSLNFSGSCSVFFRNLLFRWRLLSKDGFYTSLVKRRSDANSLGRSLSMDWKIERSPGSTEADIHDGPFANTVSAREFGHGQILPPSYLSDNLFRKAWRAVFEGSMLFGVRNVLRPCSISEIIKSWVSPVSIAMSDFFSLGARANESFGNKLVAEPIFCFPAQSQGDARVSFVEARIEQFALKLLRSASVDDCSGKATNPSETRNFVKPFAANYREPDFISVVSVENVGHVDETFCLTIPNNHSFYVECQAQSGKSGRKILIANCDDPHNAIQGESERVRNETVRWFKESMSNRVNDPEKSAIVVVHQRLNESDVAGSIIEDSEGMGYEHLCIPMRYEIDGPWAKSTKIGWEDPRKIDGELAWPERFPEKVVDDLERDLGPFGFSSQYQQNPAPRGGGIIKRHWFRLWENPQNKFPFFQNVIAAVDPAYTEKDENDPSAMAIFGTFRHPETNEFGIMLVHAWSKRLPIHGDTSPRFPGESHKAYERRCSDNWGLVEWIWHCCECYGVHQLFIEGKASGLSVFQEIERRQSLRAWACEIDTGKGAGDKVNRLTAVQPIFSQGLVWAPDRDWADLFINQLCTFPKAKHDDLVDCASSALGKMRVMGLIQHTDEREYEDYVEQNKPQALEPLYPV